MELKGKIFPTEPRNKCPMSGQGQPSHKRVKSCFLLVAAMICLLTCELLGEISMLALQRGTGLSLIT